MIAQLESFSKLRQRGSWWRLSVNSLRRATQTLLAALLLVQGLSVQALDQDLRLASPDPELQPKTVVAIQMEALGKNARWGGDQGIGVAFRFASPSNRRVTGPLERFIQLVANPAYSVMLDHEGVEVGDARLSESGTVAQVPVLVKGEGNERVGFMFSLSLQNSTQSEQSGDNENVCKCWMTDSVSRIELPDQPGQSI